MTLIIALFLGLAFGALLYRAGLARPDAVVEALRMRDLTLVKIMALGIGIGAVGIGALSSLGAAHLAIKPLYLVGVSLGGAIFGAGFAVAGYCPGTSVVASMEGRRDAWFAVLGALVGALAYVFAYPVLAPALVAPLSFGTLTLGGAMGLSPAIAGLGFGAAFAAIAFLLPAHPS